MLALLQHPSPPMWVCGFLARQRTSPARIHDHCHNGTFSDSSTSLVIYRISFADGSWTPIPLGPGGTTRDRGYFEWLEVSELGDQLVIGGGENVRSGGIRWNTGTFVNRTSDVCKNGRDERLSLVSTPAGPLGTQLFMVLRPDPAPCDGSVKGGSTVNSRRPPRPPILPPPARNPHQRHC